MRVVMVLASPWWGGQEKMFVDLANRLATHSNLSVLIPEEAPYRGRLSDDVKSVGRLPSGSRRNPRTLIRLRRAIRALEPTIVHSHAPKAAEMVHWAGVGASFAHVATKHNARRAPIFSRVRWVTTVSEQARASIPHRQGVEVVYNGIEPRSVEPTEKPDIFTIAAVGRLHSYKGFDRLVDSASRLDFPFVVEIAGEGPERDNLEALIEAAGLEDQIRLLGHREDVPELLARAHLQVVSSRTEGFSLALLEGIHYSDVVLSTPVGIAPEVMPDELLAAPTELAERIKQIHGRYAESISHFAAVKAQHRDRFSLTTAVEQYLALYQRASEYSG
jgi:glycosyltransferase involved in cell wall biosynthesis